MTLLLAISAALFESADTRGHGTLTWARFWTADLADLLAQTEEVVR